MNSNLPTDFETTVNSLQSLLFGTRAILPRLRCAPPRSKSPTEYHSTGSRPRILRGRHTCIYLHRGQWHHPTISWTESLLPSLSFIGRRQHLSIAGVSNQGVE